MDIDEKQFKDEQELAKVLAGINEQTVKTEAGSEKEEKEDIVEAVKTVPEVKPPAENASKAKPNLNNVLQDAITDLRPLVDKLNIPADEKFDTYLLLIRSTDDSTLIIPAYQTAKQISDEGKRATALLNVIKEINYFTASKPNSQKNNQGR